MSINEENYRDILIDYLENQLSAAAREEVEQYMLLHDEAWEEYKLLKNLRLKPDVEIKMPNKAFLFKTEADEVPDPRPEIVEDMKPEGRVVPVRRMLWYISGAAAIAAMLILAILTMKPSAPVAGNETATASVPGKKLPAAQIAQAPINNHKVAAIGQKEEAPRPQDKIAGLDNRQATALAASSGKKKLRAIDHTVVKAVVGHEVKRNGSNPDYIDGIETNPEMPNQVALVSPIHISPIQVHVDVKEPLVPKPLTKLQGQAPQVQENAVAQRDDDKGDGFNLLQSIYHFAKRSIKVKEQTVDGDTYYALSFETEKIKIQKSIRADF